MEIDFTPTSIIANCQFAVGSPALGCSVHIVSQDDDTSVMMLSVMRESGANEEGLSLSAEGKAEGLESGVYTVRVYDIESNGETSSSGTPAHTETVDITQPTTSPSTTPSPNGISTEEFSSTNNSSSGRP